MIVFERRACTVIFNLLKALRRPGRFLIPSNVCPIVPVVFLKANRSFEFIDISATTLCLDVAVALRRIEDDPGAIAGVFFVHTYGAMQETDASFAAIKALDPGIVVIDDRCLCAPLLQDTPSSAADAALYSTGYAKFADIGFGGFGVLGEGVPYSRCALPYSGEAVDTLTEKYKQAIASSERFVYQDSDWLDAGPLGMAEAEYHVQVVEATEQSWKQKKKLNQIYAALIPGECQLPPAFQEWRFNVLVDEKKRLIADATAQGLFLSSHYPPLSGIFGAGDASVATQFHRRVVNLFNDRYFDEERARRLASLVRDHALRTRDRRVAALDG